MEKFLGISSASTERDTIRIISARRPTPRERTDYEADA
jgi:uncharacterized DUF497 family protein